MTPGNESTLRGSRHAIYRETEARGLWRVKDPSLSYNPSTLCQLHRSRELKVQLLCLVVPGIVDMSFDCHPVVDYLDRCMRMDMTRVT
jgi:hypothetical protein